MNNQQLLEIAQIILAGRKAAGEMITPAAIDEVVRDAAKLDPGGLGADAHYRRTLREELERRFKVFVGEGIILEDQTGHLDWLPAREKETAWAFWSRYKTFVGRDIAPESVRRMDELTGEVLRRLEDPLRAGSWTRRGLVVGHVQSGKTAHYIGLICKAADAGYKVIVVLSGIHNSLRAQTQIRLEEGFVGYGQEGNPLLGGPRFAVGVSLLDPSPVANCATSRASNGDFNAAVASNFGIQPGDRPLLFVVKKNARVLQNVLDWIQTYTVDDAGSGRRLIRDVPLLLIDDEADQASIDTSQLKLDAQNNPDPDHEPTRINSLVRRLIHSFQKSAYVGYTATPFANIFIHHRAETAEEGPDLFPRSFILNLPAPSNYVGTASLFPAENDQGAHAELGKPPSLVRFVSDHQSAPGVGWLPDKHPSTHRPLYKGIDDIPPSLREAIRAFVVAGAARFARGQSREHKSMLIHVTRFTALQTAVYNQVLAEVDSLRRRWALTTSAAETEFRALWDMDFARTSHEHPGAPGTVTDWNEVRRYIGDVLDRLEVRVINNTSRDVLAYQERRDTGFHVIAVGGNKLSRGLTLEGLTVSYFLRASRMYDTLMQMGRWFGYRPGYEDLCRLYLTEDLADWFGDIAEASEELRQEFDRMVAVNETPMDYGLRVRAHPVMLVTSQLKMQSGEKLELSFSGDVMETVAFHADPNVAASNERALEGLLGGLGDARMSPRQQRPEGRIESWEGTRVWTDVSGKAILGFLGAYSSHEANRKVRTELLSRYIGKQLERGELTKWTVALLSGEDVSRRYAGLDIRRSLRSLRTGTIDGQKDRYQIRRLLSPRDEAIDIDSDGWAKALKLTKDEHHGDAGRGQKQGPPTEPAGKQIRTVRDRRTGLLLLYALGLRDSAGTMLPYTVLGIGLSFPESPDAPRVTYHVTSLYYEQEFGPDE